MTCSYIPRIGGELSQGCWTFETMQVTGMLMGALVTKLLLCRHDCHHQWMRNFHTLGSRYNLSSLDSATQSSCFKIMSFLSTVVYAYCSVNVVCSPLLAAGQAMLLVLLTQALLQLSEE